MNFLSIEKLAFRQSVNESGLFIFFYLFSHGYEKRAVLSPRKPPTVHGDRITVNITGGL